jgi:hypothetical protein
MNDEILEKILDIAEDRKAILGKTPRKGKNNNDTEFELYIDALFELKSRLEKSKNVLKNHLYISKNLWKGDIFLIWSNQKAAWWKPNSCGYTNNIEEAGRYSAEDAIKICNNANVLWTNLPDELPIQEEIAIKLERGLDVIL